MKLAILMFVLITVVMWTHQAFLGYGKSYCTVLDKWEYSTAGFKVGCTLSTKLSK